LARSALVWLSQLYELLYLVLDHSVSAILNHKMQFSPTFSKITFQCININYQNQLFHQ